MDKEQLSKDIWRYGTMLKDIEYDTIRITIWSYNSKLWYIHMDIGKVIECHELKPCDDQYHIRLSGNMVEIPIKPKED